MALSAGRSTMLRAGRMIEQTGNLRMRNGQGAGMIWFAGRISEWFTASSTNATSAWVMGSVPVAGVASLF